MTERSTSSIASSHNAGLALLSEDICPSAPGDSSPCRVVMCRQELSASHNTFVHCNTIVIENTDNSYAVGPTSQFDIGEEVHGTWGLRLAPWGTTSDGLFRFW